MLPVHSEKVLNGLTEDLVNELAQEAVDRTNLLFEATKPGPEKCLW
jgi:hypothetical protein